MKKLITWQVFLKGLEDIMTFNNCFWRLSKKNHCRLDNLLITLLEHRFLKSPLLNEMFFFTYCFLSLRIHKQFDVKQLFHINM